MDKKKILLVEDDTALAAVYRSRLELEGFEINEVNNGEDALSAAISFKPDLILLDAMMPKKKQNFYLKYSKIQFLRRNEEALGSNINGMTL